MGLIDVYRINPADQFSVFSPSLKKTQEITYYTLLAKIRGDLNITSTSGNVDNWNQAYDQTIMSGVVTGYTTKTITLTRRDGTEISFDFQDLSPASEDTLDMVTTRGNSTVNIINVGGVSTPWLDLDTSYTGTTEVGRFSWDIDNATSDLGLNNNVVLKVGQDDMWYVRNESGSAIPRGTAVMAVGTVGASGRILVSPMVANGSVAAKYLLGITSEEIADDADGYVLAKGNLRDFNTSSYTAGQVLWCNPTTPGALTATEPAAPNLKLPIAFVVHANAVGMLAVRVTTGSTLSENNQVQFGTLVNNDVLTYISANGRWQNVPISTIASTLAFSTIAVTGQSSIVAETNQDTLNIASGTGISLTTNATTDTLTITNSAPDQVVSLTAGSNVTITGTYPSFTIAATDQYSGTVTSVDLTAGSGMAVAGGPITTSGSITVTNIDKGSDQNIFKNVAVTGQGTIVADSNNDTLTVDPGTGISLTTNATTDTLTITNTAPDQVVSIAAGTGISTSGTYPSFTVTNTAPDQTVVLTGTGTTTITGTYPNFTINSDDQYDGTVTSVNLTASTGISVSGGPITSSGSITVTNTAPDQIVVLNAGTGISTSGTYPNFTVTNTAPDQVVSITAGTGMSVSGTYPSFTVTNTAPDQVVSITGAGTSVVTGTYPNFTITSNDQYVGTVTSVDLTAGTGITVSGGPITSSGSITVNNSDRGSSQNIFKNIAVPGQTTIVASTNNDTFTVKPGSGISATTLGNDITISNTDPGSAQNIFKNIAVAGQNTIVADGNNDILNFVAGTGISLTTDDTTDSLTVTNSAPDQVVALSPGTGISVSGTYPNFTITNTSPSSGGTVTSVALTAPSAFTVTGSPITTSGTIAIGGAGTASQYIRGDGQLADFPTSGGGGSSVSYYLNGSVNQGTFGGNVYREFNKTPIVGAGTDFTIAANGYIAQFITDANDPSLLEIPGGNWNIEFWFSSSSSGGSPSFYVELSKYDGTTFTPIASNSAFPEFIAFGTTVSQYYTALAVPQTTLAVTDRLALRVYVIHSGRTITLHTEDNHLCQVITTFSTGLNALNGLTKQVQYFATGTSGADFNISSVTDTHTFNIPTASAINRGALSSADWTNFTAAYNDKINSAAVTGTTTKTLTLTQQDGGTITASWTDYDTAPVTSVFGRTGAVIAVGGDYNTSQVTESGNLYFTDSRARLAISAGAGISYNNTTGVVSSTITQYTDALARASISAGTGISYNSTTGVITNSLPDQTVSITAGSGISVSGSYPSFTVASTITQYTDALARAAISLTTTGTSGAATYNNTTGVLNVPQYQSVLTNPVTGTGTTNYVSKFTGASTVGDSQIFDNGTNVGIGTATPSYKLDINGTFRTNAFFTLSNGVSYWGPYGSEYGYLTWDSGYAKVAASNTNTLYLGASNQITILSGGNVGIGTTSPSQKLDVNGYTTSQRFYPYNSNSTYISGDTGGVVVQGSGYFYVPSSGGSYFEGPVRFRGYILNDSATYLTINGGTSGFTYFSGNVGIGTTAPSSMLTLNGTTPYIRLERSGVPTWELRQNFPSTEYGFQIVNVTAGTIPFFVGNSGNVGIGTTSPLNLLHVSQASANTIFRLGNNASYDQFIYFNGGNDWSLGMDYSNSNAFVLSNSSSIGTNDRVVVTTAGNVGIGTTSPSARLHVDASGHALIVSNDTGNRRIYFGTGGTGEPDIQATLSNGTARQLSINAAGGDVGIGTTSPGAKLDVNGGANSEMRLTTSGSGILQVGQFANGAYIGTTSSDATAGILRLGTNSTERMRITSGGNVGIGTTSPAYKLDVNGDTFVNGVARISSTNPLYFEAYGGGWFMQDTSYLRTYNQKSIWTGSGFLASEGGLSVGYGGATPPWQGAIINGNVGIGTTSPSAKLNVSGDIHIGDYTTSVLRVLDLRTFNSVLTIQTDGTSGGLGTNIAYSWANGGQGPLRFSNAAGEVMRLAANGNVGIGTTSPAARLNIAGNLGSTVGGGNSAIKMTNTDTGNFASISAGIVGITNSGMEFSVDGNRAAVISGTGNVGIGTTSPAGKLDVRAGSGGKIILGSYDANFNVTIEGGDQLNFYNGASATTGYINYNGPGNILLSRNLYVEGNSSGGSSGSVRITSTGNVGIGTTSPAFKLDINGASNSSPFRVLSTNTTSLRTFFEATSGNVEQHFLYTGNQDWVLGLDKADSNKFKLASADDGFASAKLTVTTAGNVGIGTTSPAYKLDVSGTIFSGGSFGNRGVDAAYRIKFYDNGGVANDAGIGLDGSAGAEEMWFNSLNGFYWSTGTNGEKMRITQGGNVGIGTTAPNSRLSVNGGDFEFNRGTGALGNNYFVINKGASNDGGFILRRDNANDWQIVNQSGNGNLTFYSYGAASEVLTIVRSNGNVGIGTTSPSTKLQVLKGSSGNVASFASGATGTGNYSGITLHSSTSSGDDWYGSEIRSINTNGNPSFLNPRLAFFTQDYSTYLPAGRTEKMSILGNGDVGINTTAPTQKLHIVGNARITGAIYDSFNLAGSAGQVLSSTGTGTEWVTGGGGGGGSTIIVKDEGTTIGSSFTTLNFIGDNVNATASGSTAVIEVSGRASSGSIYYNDIANAFVIPGSGFTNVEINSQTVEAIAPSPLTGSNKLIATITFGVINVSTNDGFNGFKFRLYNASPMSVVPNTTHNWTGYMSKDEFCDRTQFTFHIPIDASTVTGGDTIVVQADELTNATPEIYYCALTLMEGTN